jgi:15-cis-phytoene synthase
VARDTSFYYSFLALPAAKRDAIVAVWDFCRAVDDEVDEPGTASPREALAGWRAELERCYAGQPSTTQGIRLQPWIQRFALPRPPFEALIDGVEMDLARVRYATFEELYDYCWHVASTVGLICVEIFGYRRPETREYAVDLGIALQLTNITRDVGGDLARGRVYLPQDELARFGCTEDDLRAGRVTERVRALLAHQCARAHDYFGRARSRLTREDARSLVAAEIMGAIYRDVLRRIERAGYDVFRRPIRVPRPRRALIAASVWAQTMMGWRAAS